MSRSNFGVYIGIEILLSVICDTVSIRAPKRITTVPVGNAVRAAAEGLEDGEVMILKESGGASREVVMAALNKMLNPPQWPPSFQEAGAAYTFDAASG